ncbi:MAG: hypothetical protein DMG31_08385 [Acidobacteria bacterium]|nr:MAG: hypothetical protein DMG31_08385 [Acidobacteriota bacterium]
MREAGDWAERKRDKNEGDRRCAMKVLRKKVLAAAALSAAMLFSIAGSAASQAGTADDPAVLAADRDFEQAIVKSDAAAMGKLLDSDFQWIHANGKIESRAQVLARMAELARRGEVIVDAGYPFAGKTDTRRHDYGQAAVAQTDADRNHVLRVWVKRPAGWRALVYQEVQSLDAPPKMTPSAGKECQNPCKSVPYTPKTETQRAVIEAYRGLETSAMTHDAADWDAHTGEEFVAASSYSDRLLDKPTRMAELKRANMAGLAPTPLASATLFEFGDAVVMRSRHVPDQGKPLEVTRVWVKRDGKWVEVASYQTAVQGGAS